MKKQRRAQVMAQEIRKLCMAHGVLRPGQRLPGGSKRRLQRIYRETLRGIHLIREAEQLSTDALTEMKRAGL